MKFHPLCTLLAASFFICSCVQNKTDNPVSATSKVMAAPVSTCYMAVDGRDTALLNLKTHGRKVTGILFFNYYKKNKNIGSIKGNFKGDTLLVDYLLTVEHQKTIYRNPLAFLKKDGKLIMGVGVIETAWGRNYFSRTEPIDYEKGRFVFKEVSCKSQKDLQSLQTAIQNSRTTPALLNE